MCSSEELASELVFALVSRIAANPGPTWPLPIFEAEASLYPFFLRDLLDALGGLSNSGESQKEIASCLQSPGRIVEFCYFLLGASRSGLSVSDRRRLAVSLADALAHIRPTDPLCERGANPLLTQAEVEELAAAQPSGGPDQSGTLNRLRGALLSLAEVLHVGVPQYGREVHGPYRVSAGTFMIVRDYFDFRMPEVWAPTEGFPIDRIRLTEVYRGASAIVTFDISNHMTTKEGLQRLLASQAVHVLEVTGAQQEEAADSLTESVLSLHAQLLAESSDYSSAAWLRKHHRARHHYLVPLLEHAGRPVPMPPEPASAGPAHTEPWHDMPKAQLYERLCAELGLPRSAVG